jgi:glutathione S-transferase
MPVKLHRCPVMWPKTDKHPCFNVQLALDEAGVEYELVKEPLLPRGRRKDVIEHTGQSHLPAIELEDGTWYREESAEMAKAIRAGTFGAAPHS